MKQIGKIAAKRELNINDVPQKMERYMAFMFGPNLVFLDSMQYMSSSLDKVANNLPDDKFTRTVQVFGERAELMKKKGVHPYEYMDSFGKFKTENLPNKSKFYSKQSGEDISKESYNHATKVWETFEIKNMGEYHDVAIS